MQNRVLEKEPLTAEESEHDAPLITAKSGEIQGESRCPEGPTETGSSEASAPKEPEIQEATVPLSRYEELFKAKEELLDLLLRRQAEFENIRRRNEKEKGEFQEYALSQFISKLLPALDGLERGIHSPSGENVESFKMGLALLLKQFRDILSASGVQPIIAVGEPFNPNLHFAVLKEETGAVPENQILEEYQCGYLFKDRLLRPSMVKVAVATVGGSDPQLPETVSTEAPPIPEEKPEQMGVPGKPRSS